ncbi:MAG TPA: DUF333 domain-containing protein, partial [bacterium]|nr:DUF333 domain-containing protein [bacterium]
MTYYPKNRILISVNCEKNETLDCDAYRLLLRATCQGVDSTRWIGNSGAVVCNFMGGTNVTGEDSLRNQYGFCKCEDGSMVSTSALYGFALDNDERNQKKQSQGQSLKDVNK